jgi:hypothetical protein
MRILAGGQLPFYILNRNPWIVPITQKPYMIGKKGAPLRFYGDVTDYPIFYASFRNIPPGTYYLQAAMVRAVKYKKKWYPTTIMGEMVNIPLIVQ